MRKIEYPKRWWAAGALGVAVVGTIFFDRLERHPFTSAFKHAVPIVVAVFVVAALLALLLSGTAVGEEELANL